MTIFLISVILVVLLFIFWQSSLLYASVFHVPTVYANDQAIMDALKLAGLQKGELVIDLGCGNAKVLIMASKGFQARGIGVENSYYCYLKSRFNVLLAGAHGIKIIFGDFKKVEHELATADVVYLYLLDSLLSKIEPWLFSKVGVQTRIVSLCFSFPAHEPEQESQTYNLGRRSSIKLYRK